MACMHNGMLAWRRLWRDACASSVYMQRACVILSHESATWCSETSASNHSPSPGHASGLVRWHAMRMRMPRRPASSAIARNIAR